MENVNKICRMCLSEVKNAESYRHFDDFSEKNSETIRDMLIFCLPEIDTFVSQEPIICQKCMDILNSFHNFKTNCMQNETKIKDYIKRFNINDQIDLGNLVKSNNLFSQMSNFPIIFNNNMVPFTTFICVPTFSMNDQKSEENSQENMATENMTDENAEKSFSDCEDLDILIPDVVYDTPESKKHTVQCDQCGFTTTKAFFLKKHVERVHLGIKSRRKQNFDSVKQDNPNVNLKCTKCEYVAHNSYYFEQHLKRKHVEPKKLKCEECSYETTDKSNFRKHTYVHSNQSFECTVCKYECFVPYQMSKHIKNSHNGNAKMVTKNIDENYYENPTWTGHQCE